LAAKKKHSKSGGSERDGGMFALAGYLHQMLGGAADFVRCISPREKGGPGEFQTVISFETEAAGQDLLMVGLTPTAKRLRVLTQYKFSLNPGPYPIRPQELNDIAETLKRSEAECNKSGRLPTQKILRSNRVLSPRASSSPALGEIQYEPYDPVDARKVLYSYASRFGIFEPDQLQQGVKQVIAELFELGASPGSHHLTRDQFEAALVGFNHPQPLTIGEAADEFRRRLEHQKSYRLGLDGSLLIDRMFVRDAMEQWIDDAFIVFTGNGGYGKTTALWQVLERDVDPKAIPCRLAALIVSDADMPRSFGNLIEQWRGAPDTSNAPDDVALERLKHANSEADAPILVLGLDGVDETHVSTAFREAAARIIDFFWRLHQKHKDTGAPPPARLLVTCRRQGDVHRFIDTATGLGVAGKPPAYLNFEEFTLQEIQTLLRQSGTLSSEPKHTLIATAASQLSLEYGSSSTPETTVYSVAAARCLAMLRHPILWRFFSLLTQTQQARLVDGDEESRPCKQLRRLVYQANATPPRSGCGCT